MRIQNILLASLFVSLYGCQPEVPAQQAATPVAVVPSVAPTPVPAEQVAPPAASEAAVAAPVQPAPVEKVAQPVARETIAVVQKEKASQPASVGKPAQSTPVQVVGVPTAKTEPAPVAEVKPEAPPEPAVSEADAMQLAKKNNCFACHAVGKKVVGPSFRDVAIKYRGDAAAEARLVAKIAKGGSGVWGVMVMPPSPNISEADRRILARWVLSLK